MAERFNQSNMNAIGGLPQLSNNSVQTLMSLAKEFENIADTCLLVLHIEVSKDSVDFARLDSPSILLSSQGRGSCVSYSPMIHDQCYG